MGKRGKDAGRVGFDGGLKPEPACREASQPAKAHTHSHRLGKDVCRAWRP